MNTITTPETTITDRQKQLARYARAMGHPIRVYIVELLSRQACCYSGDLAEILPIARSTLSQHLSELKDAGLIQGEITAPRIKYCLNRAAWEEMRELFGDLLEERNVFLSTIHTGEAHGR